MPRRAGRESRGGYKGLTYVSLRLRGGIHKSGETKRVYNLGYSEYRMILDEKRTSKGFDNIIDGMRQTTGGFGKHQKICLYRL